MKRVRVRLEAVRECRDEITRARFRAGLLDEG